MGVGTGIILITPLKLTVLHNISVTFEAWVVLAMIVIMNTKKPIEAAIKTLIFFLISQPLIYLVQVPFVFLSWNIFSYYKPWFYFSLLTFPGGFIAWYVKKRNWLSALILSVGTAILADSVKYYIIFVYKNHNLFEVINDIIAILFCLSFIIIFIQSFLDGLKNKVIAYTMTAVLTLFGVDVIEFLFHILYSVFPI